MRIFLASLSLLAFSFSSSSSFGHQTPSYTLNKGQIWCAHPGGVAAMYPVTCNAWGGTAFARESEAEAEHNRLTASTPKVWCATKNSIFEASESLCKSKGNKGYKYQEQKCCA